MFFWNKFCGLIIFFFILTNFSYAQYQLQAFPSTKKNSLKNNFKTIKTAVLLSSKNSLLTFYQPKSNSPLNHDQIICSLENFKTTSASIIPENFVTCDYGFFCRQELKIEKATNFPIRFRLGSLEQCNYYEGKH
jgi:hypothetical protein